MCRIGAALAAIVSALALGCAGGPDPRHAEQMTLAQHYYVNGKFYEAIGAFVRAVQNASNGREEYQATLGVANASAEYGLVLYEAAESLLRNNNRGPGLARWKEADQWHADANKAFNKCLLLRPGDKIANYNLGCFFYRRTTSFTVLPFLENEKGVAQRKAERDEAIRQFQIALSPERGDITLPKHVSECQSTHAHRYLGLVLLIRSDWDKNDGEEARRHLMVYLNYLRVTFKNVSDNPLNTDDIEQSKLTKEKSLERLRREISDTRHLLSTQHRGLQELLETWEARKEKPALPEEKREAMINAARREVAALNHLSLEFDEAVRPARKPQQPTEATEKRN